MSAPLSLTDAPWPTTSSAGSPTIAILGAAPDTGNLGVQALGFSLLNGLAARLPRARFVVFGGSSTPRVAELQTADRTVTYETRGCSLSRHPLKRGNIRRERVLHRLGLRERSGDVARTLSQADLVIDLTGGDSFTTLYGAYRFEYAIAPKHFALQCNAPLVLGPQTYGPFTPEATRIVAPILERCVRAWARDQASLALIHDLAPSTPSALCPDLAFALPNPAEMPARSETDRPRFGLNVSGLLHHLDRDSLQAQYDIPVSMRRLNVRLARRLLALDPTATLMLVPHVIAPPRHRECDEQAARAVIDALPPTLRQRVELAPAPRDALEARSLIGTCDAFVGTRMHSCIAALSQGIPTAAIAYSDKTRGVFETVDCADAVIDPRHTGTIRQIADALTDRLQRRRELAARLRQSVPQARGTIDRVFDDLAGLARAQAHRRAPTSSSLRKAA